MEHAPRGGGPGSWRWRRGGQCGVRLGLWWGWVVSGVKAAGGEGGPWFRTRSSLNLGIRDSAAAGVVMPALVSMALLGLRGCTVEGAWLKMVACGVPFVVERDGCGECKVRDRGTRTAQVPGMDRARVGIGTDKLKLRGASFFSLIPEYPSSGRYYY